MAKDNADNATADFDYTGIYNDENSVEGLGDLDLGDEVEPAEPEPDEEDAPADNAGEEDETGEVEGDEDESEEETGEPGEEDAAEGDGPAAEGGAADDEGTAKTDPEAQAPDPDKRGKQPFIPKSRFDQRTAQLRAAERELGQAQDRLKEMESEKARVEREANTMSDEQIQEKMNAANAALIEGNTEDAAKLQSEVFTALREGSKAVEQTGGGEPVDVNKVAADVRDQMAFEQSLEKIHADYPVLDEGSDSFDETISQEAVELQSYYFQQGYTRSQATERAASIIGKMHDMDPTPEQPAAKAPAGNQKADMAKKSQQASRKQKVAKARKAPPETSGTTTQGADSADSVNLDTLSVEDWSALPDSVRSRLMGDAL